MIEFILSSLIALAPIPKELKEQQRIQALRIGYVKALFIDKHPNFGMLGVRRLPNGVKETFYNISKEEHELLTAVSKDRELSMVMLGLMILDGFTIDTTHYRNRGFANVYDGITEIELYYLLWDCGRANRSR